jgi:hypothetical protein
LAGRRTPGHPVDPLRGPHDLRHTFSTWLEDAGIPARVIDELMGHDGGRRGGGAGRARQRDRASIPVDDPEKEARVVARSSSVRQFRWRLLPGSTGSSETTTELERLLEFL